jgi:hypothetical protein
MATSQGRDTTAWEGGSLPELLSFLAEASLSARIEAVDASSATAGSDTARSRVGLIDVVAGGVAEAESAGKQGDDAVAALAKRDGTHFRVELRLPNASGTLDPAGDREGSLATRSVAAIMRYCEEFVLSCALVLEQKGEVARIVYRRGEITATLVDGADAPQRLPDVMGWVEGTFHIDVVAPEVPRRARFGTPASSAAVANPTKKAGVEVPTLFGYPAPGAKPAPPPPGPGPDAPITVAGPRLGERPTPKVPLAAVTPDPGSTRPTPRAPLAATSRSATPTAPIRLTALVPTTKTRPPVAPATMPGAVPSQLTHASPRTSELRLPETGFLAQPVIVHVFVGVALGLLAVAGYWAYLRSGGTPLQLAWPPINS